MKHSIATIALAFFLLTAAAASAATSMVIGRVTHVSTTDIDIRTQQGQTMRFDIVPRFKNVFSNNGKATAQMSALRPGTPVTIYYNRVLGTKHATRILVNGSVKALKS